MSGVKGTLWAAYNGVTEMLDHRGSKRQKKDSPRGGFFFGCELVMRGATRQASVAL